MKKEQENNISRLNIEKLIQNISVCISSALLTVIRSNISILYFHSLLTNLTILEQKFLLALLQPGKCMVIDMYLHRSKPFCLSFDQYGQLLMFTRMVIVVKTSLPADTQCSSGQGGWGNGCGGRGSFHYPPLGLQCSNMCLLISS